MMAEAPPKERMPTYKSLWEVPIFIHNIGDLKLPREVTVLQLFVSFICALIVTFKIATPLFGTRYAFVLGICTLIFLPGLIARVEAAAGRNPIKELYSWIAFFLTKKRYWIGTRQARPKETERLKAMFDRERELAGEARIEIKVLVKHTLKRMGHTLRGGGAGA